jgi:hypothetical protein
MDSLFFIPTAEVCYMQRSVLTGILIGHSLRDISKVEIFLKKLVNT